MPVCIAGMHRSGTSMVSRLINQCGVYLGPENELMSPAPDNPEGYWENIHFVDLNVRLLAHLRAGGDFAPAVDKEWELDPEIAGLRKEAAELINRFNAHNLWGWKDPRNSLTLPFWRRLIPDLKIIICVRNPLEVARSLFVRGDSLRPSEFQLWLVYYRQLLSTTQPTDRVVTHYQSYFQNAAAELRRIFRWLEFEVRDESIERASAHVSAELRHHYAVTTELVETKVPDEVLSLYLELCDEAGSVYQEARKPETAADARLSAVRANEVKVLMEKLQQLRLDYAARELAYAELERHCAAQERTLNEILNSKAFRLVSWYWRMRRRK